MFKTMLQLAMLAAVLGVAKSSYNNGAFNGIDFQPIISTLQGVTGTAKSLGVPGSQDAAKGAGVAIDAIKNLDIAKKPEKASEGTESATDGAKDAPHAFYKSEAGKCPGITLAIDLQSGVATCRNKQQP